MTPTNTNAGAETMTVNEAVAAMLALYATPGTWVQAGIAQDAAGRPVEAESLEAVAWSLEGAMYRVVGDPDAKGITKTEWQRRIALVAAVMGAFDVDLMAFNDAARHQRAVVSVLRAELSCERMPT
ncbi:hypothetical protein MKK70_25330 [Methylobacterium sp. E-041]|uniref:DUF6197 family protein n=1 Tax=Methylobacterium sp. E-041 TaxID=2836573 RepID=UPI001FB8BB04|nr:hypothetical protein [Methylobacterium sp. E-041]MCJ2108635.1 hypothetical protein [Methylobacterium sp. E-041]